MFCKVWPCVVRSKSWARQLKATHRSNTSNRGGVFQHFRCHATLNIPCVISALTALGIDIVEESLKFQRGNKSDADVSTEKDLLVQFNELTTLEKERMLNTNEKFGMNTLQRLMFGFGIKGYVIEHIAKTQTRALLLPTNITGNKTCVALPRILLELFAQKRPQGGMQTCEPAGPAMNYKPPLCCRLLPRMANTWLAKRGRERL